mmetsp:Transcript_247/g.801  ORF Transcript_247/g.801 Transcript_247/m.801 type:complete len:1043 (+) Transcript_247:305-3433(+)
MRCVIIDELRRSVDRQAAVHGDVGPLVLNLELLHRLDDHLGFDLALSRQRGERGDRDALLVHLEEAPQLHPRVRPAEAVRPQNDEVAADVLLDQLRVLRDVIRGEDCDAVVVAQTVLDPEAWRLLHGVQARVPLFAEGFPMHLADVRGAPELAADAELGEEVDGIKDLLHDRPGADKPDGEVLVSRRLRELVQPLQAPLFRGLPEGLHLGHGGLDVVLVVHGDVVDQVLVFAPHLLDAVFDDVGQLIGERRVPTDHRRVRERNQQRVAILVLQTFAVQRGAAGRGAEEEAPGPGVRGLPDEVAHALEAEHRVIDKERQHGTSLGGVRGAGRDPRAQRAGLGDAFLQHLPVGRLGILHERVVVNRGVVLAEGGMDLELVEKRVQAESARLVRHHGANPLAEVARLHHPPEQIRERHRRAHLLGASLVEAGPDARVGQSDQAADLGRRPHRVATAERRAALQHVLHLRRVGSGVPEELAAKAGTTHLDLLVGQRDLQNSAEVHHLFLLHRLLLMDRVAPLEGGQTESLQRFSQDHRRTSSALCVLLRLCERRVDLLVVVAARLQVCGKQLIVAPMLDQVADAVVDEHFLPQKGTILLRGEALTIAIGSSLQHIDKAPVAVPLNEAGPCATPDELDAVVARAAEDALEFLDDLRVPPHRPVQPLVVAVDHHDQVVQALVAGPGDGVDRLRLVHLAVADEAPDAAAGSVRHASEVQVAEEARLRDGGEGADAHRHGRILPEVRHEPGMRIAGHALPVDLLPKAHDPLQGQAALEVGARVRAGRRMALHVDLVAHAAGVSFPTKEMVHADLPHVADRGEGADVAADPCGSLVAVTDHHSGIPADQVGDAPLHSQVAGIRGFHARRDGVQHRSGDGRGHLQALANRLVDELVHQEARLQWAVVVDDGVQRLEPLLALVPVEHVEVRLQRDEVRGVVAPVLVHEGQGRGELRHLSAEGLGEVSIGDPANLGHVEVREEGFHLLALQGDADLGHEACELLRLQEHGAVDIGPREPLVRELVEAGGAVLFDDLPELEDELLGVAVPEVCRA